MAQMTGREEFARGWPLVLASLIGIACSISAIPFYSFGAFIGPLEAEFGWTRGEIQTGYGLQTLVAAVLGVAVGYAVDRFGPRPVALLSLLGMGVGLALFSQLTASIWTLYAALVMVSVLGVGSTPITWSRAIIASFYARRGLALGIALTGTGVCAALIPNYATWAIASFGWQGAYLALAALPLLLALPVVFLLFKVPKDAPSAAVDDKPAAASATTGMTLGQAMGTPRYWILILASLLMPIGVSGVISSLIPLLTDAGSTPAQAAQVAGLVGIAVITGRLVAGWALDRFWAPAVGMVCLLLPALGALLLASSPDILLLAMVAAFLVGFGGGAEFDLVAFISARYFGMAHYGKIYGICFAAFAIGAALAQPLFGQIFDATGSYVLAFYIAAGCFLLAGLMLLTLGRYPDLSRYAAANPEPA